MKELFDILPQMGKVEWIGIRQEKRATPKVIDTVEVTLDDGLLGDHYKGKSKKRQVTLIQKEHLDAVAGILKLEQVDPGLTRRNIVISGINLLALKDRQFQIGEVILEMTGFCYPCSRMEENFGPGGFNAMRGHGGINAKVIRGGTIHLGDDVKLLENKSTKTDS
jgi:MOSC domain-containing protein YiiM